MRRVRGRAWCFVVVGLLSGAAGAAPPLGVWRELGAGVEYGEMKPPAALGGGDLHVVRIDPAKARLRAVVASAADRKPRTAGAWCDKEKLAAAINLGMFLDDGIANVGYARIGAHVNHGRWVKKYQSAFVMGPKKAGLAAAAILDLDAPGARARLDDYETVVQNLRLIGAPGKSAWGPGARRWSEAAVAMDRAGRILFAFSRVPRSMHDFNRMLLGLPLEVVAAMHVEGGPEASLSLRGKVSLDLNGSFETGFNENDQIAQQWPIPNVLGVAAAGR